MDVDVNEVREALERLNGQLAKSQQNECVDATAHRMSRVHCEPADELDLRDCETVIWWASAELAVRDRQDCQRASVDKEWAKRINDEAMSGDFESDHGKADDILCELLKQLGFGETVAAFEKVGKWYA